MLRLTQRTAHGAHFTPRAAPCDTRSMLTRRSLTDKDAGHQARILTIDGGPGALIALPVLRELEKWCLRKGLGSFIERTDLFSGTSDGGLAALYLATAIGDGASGLEAIEGCIEFARQYSLAAGVGPFAALRMMKGAMFPMYSQTELRYVFASYLGDRTLGDIKRPVAIMAFDAVRWTPVSFRNFQPADTSACSVLDVAISTASCPILLPPNVMHVGATWKENLCNPDPNEGWVVHPVIDGLAANNNPTWSAVNHALLWYNAIYDNQGWYYKDNHALIPYIRLLSIGVKALERRSPWYDDHRSWLDIYYPKIAAMFPEPVREMIRRRLRLDEIGAAPLGLFPWLLYTAGFGLPNLFIQGSSALEDESARTLFGPDHYLRFEPEIPIWDVIGIVATGTEQQIRDRLEERAAEVWDYEQRRLEAIDAFRAMHPQSGSPAWHEARRKLIHDYHVPVYINEKDRTYSVEDDVALLKWIPETWMVGETLTELMNSPAQTAQTVSSASTP